VDACNEAADACDNLPNDAQCNDGNMCTTDTCDVVAGCVIEAVDCNDGQSCTLDSCSAATGQCDNELNAGSCLIDAGCYDHDELNPVNECEICDTASPLSWTPSEPTEVTDVVVQHIGGSTRISWPSNGIGFVYDVAGEAVTEMHAAGGVEDAICLVDDHTDMTWDDPRPDPVANEGNYYLVRSQKTCATGTYGVASDESERLLTNACP
jgi:hypothetical protein